MKGSPRRFMGLRSVRHRSPRRTASSPQKRAARSSSAAAVPKAHKHKNKLSTFISLQNQTPPGKSPAVFSIGGCEENVKPNARLHMEINFEATIP